jgi:hypothetical protein
MRTISADGVEECEECSAIVQVWKLDNGRRVFEEHYSHYPKRCIAVPNEERI